jgi:hypothetical protein
MVRSRPEMKDTHVGAPMKTIQVDSSLGKLHRMATIVEALVAKFIPPKSTEEKTAA